MPPKLKDVAKDRHQLDIYAKWILKSSNTQVNLPSSIQSQLDKLAAAKK